MRTVAALPGDERFGHLPDDVDEDYLSALTGLVHVTGIRAVICASSRLWR